VCEGDEPYAVRSLISAGVGVRLISAAARAFTEFAAARTWPSDA